MLDRALYEKSGAGGLLPKEQAIRIWEESAGRPVDRTALHWWELFSSVKGQGIWVSSQREYLDALSEAWQSRVELDLAAGRLPVPTDPNRSIEP